MSELLAEPYTDLEQQRESAQLGMWVFLATEVLFFGALFAAYTVYRFRDPAAFRLGGKEMSFLIGTLNTAVLLTSSLTMALGVHAAKAGDKRAVARWLGLTAAIGFVFLALKGVEYHEHLKDGFTPGTSMFFFLYYAMTGLHALHVAIGLCVVGTTAFFARRGSFSAEWHTPVELAGLYWHFVDVVWVFLYPMLYLIPKP